MLHRLAVIMARKAAGFGLVALAMLPVPVAAQAIEPADAVAAMLRDDAVVAPANVIAQARRMFLDALASEHTDAATLSRMLPRAGQPVAALIGAAPAGQPRAEAVLERLGLDPERFLGPQRSLGIARAARGGPFIAARDTRVRDLLEHQAARAEVAAAFARIPAFMPVGSLRESSGFGYRSDPFHGGGAFHAGVDLTGKSGESIHAAADGVVVRAGWWAGYGKVVVIDHGNGLESRYGHLSGIHVREGDSVRQGSTIGAMGSTGRSTGTHLHFEVRVDGRALDPQPFLDLASFGLDAPARTAPVMTVAAPDEPFSPLLGDDRVMAAGKAWSPRTGR